MPKATVIYYTSNREEAGFEAKIRDKLWQAKGDLPLISVSHKPIDFGQNICIGVRQPSDKMVFVQLLEGCKAAKTPFIINAEADFMYCPDYFKCIPGQTDKIYRYKHIRVAYKYHWGWFRKVYSEGAQMVGRQYLIKMLEHDLEHAHEDENKFTTYKDVRFEWYGSDTACLTFKTGDSLHKYVAVERERSKHELPYWGSIADMRRELFNL